MRVCFALSKHIALWLVVLCVAFLVGCSKDVAQLDKKEREQPEMRKASSIADSGNSITAIDLYFKALEKNPSWAKAHLELGLLFHDMDQVSAIYHYKKYLHLRPETEKREMIEGRIQAAKAMLVSSVLSEIGQLGEGDAVSQAALKNVKELNKRIATLEKENAGLMQEKTRLEAELKTERLAGSSKPAKPKIYRVQSGDTLSGIAATMYDDKEKWKIIYDANRGELAGLKSLKVGQALIIPEPDDAATLEN